MTRICAFGDALGDHDAVGLVDALRAGKVSAAWWVSSRQGAGCRSTRKPPRCRCTSGDPGFDFFRLSFESLRAALVDAGQLADEDADAASSRFGEGMRLFTLLMVAGIGRRA